MLAIRLQRTGRKGHAQYRVVVQDAQRTPTSGRIVANLGNYNPHTKQAALDKEKADFYLKNGAQPSDRVARLLKTEGVKLPDWVKLAADKQRSIRNADKLRKNRPASAEATEDKPAEEVAEEPAAEASETPAEEAATEAEAPDEAAPTETKPAE